MRILVANRGEIARRVIRTATRLGHDTVAVYADPDAGAAFVDEADVAVRIGPADLSASYLSIDAVVDAIRSTGADAVHPGYGFLSENASFARAVVDAGAIWIGPHAEAIESMGSKINARRLASEAGVPIIPGYDESQDPSELAAAADRIGYPVLVKAAAGGGGKGIRIVSSPDEFDAALAEASTEAQRSFGDGAMIVERYIQRPRHVEVQIVGDRHGGAIHLGTRECSVQRRYQKVLEEAPAPNLPDETRSGLEESAVRLAASIGYDSAGTVEYVVDDESSDYFFLEMNTRLQVEHPVTEFVTGLDLVEMMIGVAAGAPLPIGQDDVTFSEHAVEARINAEDPWRGFVPQTGRVTHLSVPDDVRWDAAVRHGDEITPHYDPMIAKLVVDGPDRASALRRLGRALDHLVLGGLVTNTGFHRWLIEQSPVAEGRVTTRFLDETDLPAPPDPATRAAAAAWTATRRRPLRVRPETDARVPSVWSAVTDFRTTPHRPDRTLALCDLDGEVYEVQVDRDDETGTAANVTAVDVDLGARSVAVVVDGTTQTFTVPTRSEHWAPSAGVGHGHAGAVVSPFPASVASVEVEPGQTVGAGDTVVVIEAMKMLHSLAAAGPGTVDEVRVAVGDQVESKQVLVTFTDDGEGGSVDGDDADESS